MGIKITLEAKNTSYEGRFALHFRRERRDVANLLVELKKGKTLDSIFPKPVAKSVSKKLIDQSFVDRSESLTVTGENFIKYPYLKENERGIYSLTVASFDRSDFDFRIAISIERKLSEKEAQLEPVSIPLLVQGNEFTFANERNEIGVLDSVELISDGKAYVVPKGENEIVFDLTKGTYETDGEYRMGENLSAYVAKYAKRVVSENTNSFEITDDFKILVKNPKDISVQDMLDGNLSKTKVGVVDINNVPLLIIDSDLAKRYAYLWLYDLLMKGNYYSISEMSEIVQNEVSSKPIIDVSLRNEMSVMTVSKDGFKKYLPAEYYEKLEYKLRIMDEYLGIESIVEDANFAKVKDYHSLSSYIADIVSPSDVSKMYLVMGYAFVKRKDNRILECVDALKRTFDDLTIVCKKGKTSQEEEPGLREKISGMGVKIVDKTGLSEHFHDRYIIFELKNGTFATFLCTAEIGQIFHNGETKGSIIKIPNSDTKKGGTSLIEMIKE